MRASILSVVALLGLVATTSTAVDLPAVAVVAESGTENQAALIEAALSASQAGVRLLDRVLLSSILTERELSAKVMAAKIPAAAAVVLVETTVVEKKSWLIARLVAAQTSAVLGMEMAAAGDAKILDQWSQRVAKMVNAKIDLLARPVAGLVPVSLVNFRRAFEAGALDQLRAEPQATRLLASRLQSMPDCVVLDRANLATLKLEKELSPISEEWWRSGWMIDGTYQPKGARFEATLTLRRQQGAPQSLTLISDAPGLAALTDAIANALASRLNLPPGAPLNPEAEGYAYGVEAEWLWDVGLRDAAATAALAARELGSRHRAAVSVPVTRWWFQAWPNLVQMSYDKDNPSRLILRLRELGGRETDFYNAFISKAESTWLIHSEDGREFRPQPAQMTAVGNALEELVNYLPRRPAPGPADWANDMQRSLWLFTLGLGAHLLDIEYAFPADKGGQPENAKVLRQKMRDALVQLKNERPWYLKPLLPLKPMLGETLNESASAMESCLQGLAADSDSPDQMAEARRQQRMELMWWTSSRTHASGNSPPLADEVWRPALYDWQKRDRSQGANLAEKLFQKMIAESDPIRQMDGAFLQLVWTSEPKQLERSLSTFLKRLTKGDIPAPERGVLIASVDQLDRMAHVTESALEAGHPALLDDWVALANSLCRLNDPAVLILGRNLARYWEHRRDREKWAAPLFTAMLAVARQTSNQSLSEPATLAGYLHHELAATPTSPSLNRPAGKVVSMSRWWPSKKQDYENLTMLDAVDLDGDSIYVMPAKRGAPSIEIIKLDAATMKERQTWKLPLRPRIDASLWGTHATLRVVNGRAHVGIGERMMSFNLNSKVVEANYTSPELNDLRAIWNEGHWYGYTSERPQLAGDLVADIDAVAGKHRMLADTLRNPPLHSLDGSSGDTWKPAWPLVPISSDKLLAQMGQKGWFLFDLKTGMPTPWLQRDSGWITELGSNSLFKSRAKFSGPWMTLTGMTREDSWNFKWNVIAFDTATGRRWTLLWGGKNPLHVVGEAISEAPKFDQPEGPGYKQSSSTCGPSAFDGAHLALMSRYCDRELRLRLHLWKAGTREAKTVLLDTPTSCPLWNEEDVRSAHRGMTLVGDGPHPSEGKVRVQDLCCSPAGVLLRCSGIKFSSEALTFISWSELGL